MPVYWFALSFVDTINWGRAGLIFLLIHVLLYPSSNGYNSYMDRDTGSIGGVENPMLPTKQLFYVTVVMDILAATISLFISFPFAMALIVYIVCSRLYSYRGIRLKQFPIIGYLTVIVNQGAVIFFMVYHGAGSHLTTQLPWYGLTASGFLIGGFYPLTQVYQHGPDKADGVQTLSMLLGKRGTFIFCAIMYLVAFTILFFYYQSIRQIQSFLVLQIFFIPVAVYFMRWLLMVWKDAGKADFKHTMQMNWLAGTLTNLAFITLLILHYFG